MITLAQSIAERREARKIAKRNQRQREDWANRVRIALGNDRELAAKLLAEDPDLVDALLAELADQPAKVRGGGISLRYCPRSFGYAVTADSPEEAWECVGHDPTAANGKRGAYAVNLDHERTWGPYRVLNRPLILRRNEMAAEVKDWNASS